MYNEMTKKTLLYTDRAKMTNPRFYFMHSLIGIIIIVQLTRLAQIMECLYPMTQQPAQTSH